MAVAQSAYRSSINISNISKSVSSLGKGIKQAKSSALRTNTILLKSTRFKRESIARDNVFFQRRRESVRRKEQEDIIESSGIRGAFKRQKEVIASSTKGFLGRIMDFVGTLMVGWLVNNLPLIIKLGEQVIQKIQGIVGALGGFISGVQQTLSGFGNLLVGVFSNVVQFKFSNIGTDISNSMNQITSGFESIEKSFDDALNLLKEPLDFTKPDIPQGGVLPRDGQIPPDQTNPPGSQPSGGGLPNSQSPEMYRIAAALSTEGSGAQSTVDMMQVVVNRKASGKYGSSYTEILSRPAQFEGVEKKGVGGFKKIQTLQDASKWSGQSEATLLGIIRNIQDPSLQASSAKYVGGAFEFRAAPQYYLKYGLVPGEMGPDGRFYGSGWRGGSGDNQFLKDPVRDKSRINPAGPASFNLPKPVQQAQTAPAVTTSVQDQFKGRPGGAAGQITGVFGEQRKSGRKHAGIDIAPAGPGYYVALKQSGKIDYVGFDPGGYGNFVDIKSGNTIYRFAHLAKVFVKNGQSYNGQTIGEIGSTGGSTGIHLHFEVRPNGKAIDPRPYIGMLSIGKTLTGVAGQPTTITTPAKITAPSTGSTKQMKAMTPERSGPTVVVAQPQAPQMQAPMGGGGGGQSMPNVSSGEIELNRLMTQRLLLELAYT
jgi:murein DD-endopeptidase MepM/ murein hydrolase activator NlpD